MTKAHLEELRNQIKICEEIHSEQDIYHPFGHTELTPDELQNVFNLAEAGLELREELGEFFVQNHTSVKLSPLIRKFDEKVK